MKKEQRKKINLEDRVMDEIKIKGIDIKSKYVFVAKKLGLDSGLILSIVLAAFFSNLFLFYLRTQGSLEYLSFGKDGLLAFLESFPYVWVMLSMLFIIISGYFLTKFDISYKKPFKYLILWIILFVVASGTVLAFSGASDRLDEIAYKNSGLRILKPFYGKEIEERNRGVIGKVDIISKDYLVVLTPVGERKISIVNRGLSEKIELMEIKKGDVVIAIGELNGEIFVANNIKKVARKQVREFREKRIPGKVKGKIKKRLRQRQAF